MTRYCLINSGKWYIGVYHASPDPNTAAWSSKLMDCMILLPNVETAQICGCIAAGSDELSQVWHMCN